MFEYAFNRGFTLLELVITLMVIGILTNIAYPAYLQHVLKSRRSDAAIAVLEIANLQEQFFLENNSYSDSLANGSNILPVNPCGLGYGNLVGGIFYTLNGYYSIAITNPITTPTLMVSGATCTITTATSDFVATATGVNSQATDTDCATLSIDHTGSLTSTGGGNCW